MSVDYMVFEAYLIPLADAETAVCKKTAIAKRLEHLRKKHKSWSEAEARKVAIRYAIETVLRWCGFERFAKSGPESRWQVFAGGGVSQGDLGGGIVFRARTLACDGCDMIQGAEFDFDTDYLAFCEGDFFEEIWKGKVRIIKPRQRYSRLCRFLGVEEIPKYQWVYISA